MGKSAPASAPTLRKLGADLRWLIEKSGVNPEHTLVTVGVPTVAAQNALVATLQREFDPACMYSRAAHVIVIHGVHVCVTVSPQVVSITSAKPQEPA